MSLSSLQVERYSRQILLREVGGIGQERLLEAGVLVVGAGPMGAVTLLYLAAAGVGRLVVVDDGRQSAAPMPWAVGTGVTRAAAAVAELTRRYPETVAVVGEGMSSVGREWLAVVDGVVVADPEVPWRWTVDAGKFLLRGEECPRFGGWFDGGSVLMSGLVGTWLATETIKRLIRY